MHAAASNDFLVDNTKTKKMSIAGNQENADDDGNGQLTIMDDAPKRWARCHASGKGELLHFEAQIFKKEQERTSLALLLWLDEFTKKKAVIKRRLI
jgi:hypothetical protein